MFDYQELHKILAAAPVQDLSRIITMASDYNPVIRRISMLHAVFLRFSDEKTLCGAITEAATIDDYISYREADGYSQILGEIEIVIKRVIDNGQLPLAQKLLNIAIATADESSENIQDGAYWEMGISDLQKLVDKISGQES